MTGRSHLAAALACLGLLSACSGPGVPTPTPTPGPGQQAYADDFSNPSSGWPVESNPTHKLGYTTVAGPGYTIQTLTAGASVDVNSPAAALPHSLRIEVTIAVNGKGGDASNGDAGVGCWYDSTGYVFMLHPGGGYSIVQESTTSGSSTLTDVPSGNTRWIVPSPRSNLVDLTCTPGAAGVGLKVAVNGSDTAQISAPGGAEALHAKKVQVLFHGDSDQDESDAVFTQLTVFVV